VLERSAIAAERGLLDAVFFADSPGLAIFRARYFPQVGFDPLELLAALSRSTTRIGLIATASTTYSAPYDLARRLATIDHLSGGRAGRNIVTTRYAGAAGNFGLAAHPDPADRYARAAEFVDVVTRLWDSWDAGASDGFTLQPTTLPGSIELFTEHVVPILQRRGLHRTEYTATTLRGHLQETR
jgi:alkanesulfonate monooxygenase SsuD/methylene tetrahydromethanopterin reductase-like flavin-dependent oxidoreductase (luciferase family)